MRVLLTRARKGAEETSHAKSVRLSSSFWGSQGGGGYHQWHVGSSHGARWIGVSHKLYRRPIPPLVNHSAGDVTWGCGTWAGDRSDHHSSTARLGIVRGNGWSAVLAV
jgi:hypothetical protein